jgi:hypothetical protein
MNAPLRATLSVASSALERMTRSSSPARTSLIDKIKAPNRSTVRIATTGPNAGTAIAANLYSLQGTIPKVQSLHPENSLNERQYQSVWAG